MKTRDRAEKVARRYGVGLRFAVFLDRELRGRLILFVVMAGILGAHIAVGIIKTLAPELVSPGLDGPIHLIYPEIAMFGVSALLVLSYFWLYKGVKQDD